MSRRFAGALLFIFSAVIAAAAASEKKTENSVKTSSFSKSSIGTLEVELFQISSREGRCSTEVTEIRGLPPAAQKALNERFKKEKQTAIEECRGEIGATRYSSTESVQIVGAILRISNTGEYFGDGAAHVNTWIDAAHLFEMKTGQEVQLDDAAVSPAALAMAACSIRALFKGGAYDGDEAIGKSLTLDVDKSGDKTSFVLRQANVCTTCTETAAKLLLPKFSAERLLKPTVFSFLKSESMLAAFPETGSPALDAALKNCFESPAAASTPAIAP